MILCKILASVGWVTSNSPFQTICPAQSLHVRDPPPEFDPRICFHLSQNSLCSQRRLLGGFAAQLWLTGPYGDWTLSCNVHPFGCSTSCSVSRLLFAENWQHWGAVHVPHGVEPRPGGPASGQVHPGKDTTTVRISPVWMQDHSRNIIINSSLVSVSNHWKSHLHEACQKRHLLVLNVTYRFISDSVGDSLTWLVLWLERHSQPWFCQWQNCYSLTIDGPLDGTM